MRGLVFGDCHLDAHEEIHPVYQLFKDFAKDFKPDFIVDLGDTLDLNYFSTYSRENLVVLGDCNWEEDVDLLNWELDYFQKIVGGNYHWRLGNHDYRTVRMGERVPAFRDSLNYRKRFHVAARGIHMYEPEDPPTKIGKCNFIHGWYTNLHHAKKHLERYSGNIVYGHVHKRQTFSKELVAEGKTIHAWSLGCLCDKQPHYAKGMPLHHEHGFGVLYVDEDGNFNFYPVDINGGKFMWDGYVWEVDK
jgi:predicted phosphodiesterase